MIVKFSTHDAKVCINPTQGSSSKLVEVNYHQVYLALNIFAGIMEDVGLTFGLQLDVKHTLLSAGLTWFVEECSTLSEGILEGLGTPSLIDTTSAYKWRDAYSGTPGVSSITNALDYICTVAAQDEVDAVRRLLEFLLFFDRFTYIADEATISGAFEKFRRVNRRCRDFARKDTAWPGPAIRDAVHEELEIIYTPADWHYKVSDCHFSSGSTVDSGPLLIKKLETLSKYCGFLYNSPLYPLEDGERRWCSASVPRLIAVPKGLGSRRVIAPELTVLGYYAQGALEALRRMLDRNGTAAFINEHDQSVNQEFARIGAANGEWATIDMSSASDSIGKSLFLSCLPMPFHEMYLNYMSWDISIPRGKGKAEVVPLHTLFTSGNPLTWLTEACWFLALSRVGARLAGVSNYRTKIFAYGDDLIVPTECYETVCEVLEVFGHTVNRRKSYGAGVFRESCGGWYCHGVNVTPTYWPRREVSDDLPDQLSCLTSLQHNLYLAGYYAGAARCAELAQDLYGSITFSEVGSTNDDLWDDSLDAYSSAKYRHTCFTQEWTAKRKLLSDPTLARLYEMYVYVKYLKEGPFYESSLDQLLGTSSSRYRPLEAFGIPFLRVTKR